MLQATEPSREGGKEGEGGGGGGRGETTVYSKNHSRNPRGSEEASGAVQCSGVQWGMCSGGCAVLGWQAVAMDSRAFMGTIPDRRYPRCTFIAGSGLCISPCPPAVRVLASSPDGVCLWLEGVKEGAAEGCLHMAAASSDCDDDGRAHGGCAAQLQQSRTWHHHLSVQNMVAQPAVQDAGVQMGGAEDVASLPTVGAGWGRHVARARICGTQAPPPARCGRWFRCTRTSSGSPRPAAACHQCDKHKRCTSVRK